MCLTALVTLLMQIPLTKYNQVMNTDVLCINQLSVHEGLKSVPPLPAVFCFCSTPTQIFEGLFAVSSTNVK